jgi:hypothetical protein
LAFSRQSARFERDVYACTGRVRMHTSCTGTTLVKLRTHDKRFASRLASAVFPVQSSCLQETGAVPLLALTRFIADTAATLARPVRTSDRNGAFELPSPKKRHATVATVHFRDRACGRTQTACPTSGWCCCDTLARLELEHTASCACTRSQVGALQLGQSLACTFQSAWVQSASNWRRRNRCTPWHCR